MKILNQFDFNSIRGKFIYGWASARTTRENAVKADQANEELSQSEAIVKDIQTDLLSFENKICRQVKTGDTLAEIATALGESYAGSKVKDQRAEKLGPALILPGQYVWIEDGQIVISDAAPKTENSGGDVPPKPPVVETDGAVPPKPPVVPEGDPETQELFPTENPELEKSLEDKYGKFNDWFNGLTPEQQTELREALGLDDGENASWCKVCHWIENAAGKTWDAVKTAATWVWELPGNMLEWFFGIETFGIGETLQEWYKAAGCATDTAKQYVIDAYDSVVNPEELRDRKWAELKPKLELLEQEGIIDIHEIKERDDETPEMTAAREAREELREDLENMKGLWTKDMVQMLEKFRATDLTIGAEAFDQGAIDYMKSSNTFGGTEEMPFRVTNLTIPNMISGDVENMQTKTIPTLEAFGSMINKSDTHVPEHAPLKIYLPSLGDKGMGAAAGKYALDAWNWGKDAITGSDSPDEYKAERQKIKAFLDKYPGRIIVNPPFEVEDDVLKEWGEKISSLWAKNDEVEDSLRKAVMPDQYPGKTQEQYVEDAIEHMKNAPYLTRPIVYLLSQDIFSKEQVSFMDDDFLFEKAIFDANQERGNIANIDLKGVRFGMEDLRYATFTYEHNGEEVAPADFDPEYAHVYERDVDDKIEMFSEDDTDKIGEKFAESIRGKNVVFTNLDDTDENKLFIEHCFNNGIKIDVTGNDDMADHWDKLELGRRAQYGIDMDKVKANTPFNPEEFKKLLTNNSEEALHSIPSNLISLIRNNLDAFRKDPALRDGLNFQSFEDIYLAYEENIQSLASLPIDILGPTKLAAEIQRYRAEKIRKALDSVKGDRLSDLPTDVLNIVGFTTLDKDLQIELKLMLNNEIMAEGGTQLAQQIDALAKKRNKEKKTLDNLRDDSAEKKNSIAQLQKEKKRIEDDTQWYYLETKDGRELSSEFQTNFPGIKNYSDIQPMIDDLQGQIPALETEISNQDAVVKRLELRISSLDELDEISKAEGTISRKILMVLFENDEFMVHEFVEALSEKNNQLDEEEDDEGEGLDFDLGDDLDLDLDLGDDLDLDLDF